MRQRIPVLSVLTFSTNKKMHITPHTYTYITIYPGLEARSTLLLVCLRKTKNAQWGSDSTFIVGRECANNLTTVASMVLIKISEFHWPFPLFLQVSFLLFSVVLTFF